MKTDGKVTGKEGTWSKERRDKEEEQKKSQNLKGLEKNNYIILVYAPVSAKGLIAIQLNLILSSKKKRWNVKLHHVQEIEARIAQTFAHAFTRTTKRLFSFWNGFVSCLI
jgi:hypothetical protein